MSSRAAAGLRPGPVPGPANKLRGRLYKASVLAKPRHIPCRVDEPARWAVSSFYWPPLEAHG